MILEKREERGRERETWTGWLPKLPQQGIKLVTCCVWDDTLINHATPIRATTLTPAGIFSLQPFLVDTALSSLQNSGLPGP